MMSLIARFVRSVRIFVMLKGFIVFNRFAFDVMLYYNANQLYRDDLNRAVLWKLDG